MSLFHWVHPSIVQWCIIVLEKLARITLLYVSLPSPGISFPSLCDRNAIDLRDLLPFLGECQLSMLRRCHCYPRFPSVPGGGHHWEDIIVPCNKHISTEELFQLALFSMKKVSLQDLFGEFSYQISIFPSISSTMGSFLDHFSPNIRLTNPCINLKRIKIILRTKYCHLWAFQIFTTSNCLLPIGGGNSHLNGGMFNQYEFSPTFVWLHFELCLHSELAFFLSY